MYERLFAHNRIDLPELIYTERVDRVDIGKRVLTVKQLNSWNPDVKVIDLLNALNGNGMDSQVLRRKLLFSLNNNTPNQYPEIRHRRAVSAYFTYNPNDETVIIEWGTIDPNSSEAKLHSYLNRMIKYRERVGSGMKVSSGHLAKLQDGEEYPPFYLALFDNIVESTILHKESPFGKTVNTLYPSGFIPISADGYVKLPAFR